jgi:hypothetical protein
MNELRVAFNRVSIYDPLILYMPCMDNSLLGEILNDLTCIQEL